MKRKNRDGHRHSQDDQAADNGGEIPKPPANAVVDIPQPLIVERHSTPEENEQYAEQRASRHSQLRAAQVLNRITIAGIIIGLGSLLGLYATLAQGRTTTQVDQRAWVGPRNLAITNLPIEADKAIEVGMDYANFGKTPATYVTGYAEVLFTVAGSKLDFSKWSDPLTTETAVLFPGASNHITRTVMKDLPKWPADAIVKGIPKELLPDFEAGRSLIYFYGSLNYYDIFGYHHWAHFCVNYSVAYKGFVYCDTFNAVDGEQR